MKSETIPFNRPHYSLEDLAAAETSMKSGHTAGNGPYTQRAEKQLAILQSSGRNLLTTSCTHALELSARLLEIQPGDEVIVPSFTFVSTASAFASFGATPVFVDSRPDTLNIDEGKIREVITGRTKAICVVHYAGVGCNMEEISLIAAEHNLRLIEDNAHGFLATLNGKTLGTIGDISTLSFHETKNITCGEGGAINLNDPLLVEKAEILREKGTDRARFLRGQVDKYTWSEIGSSWVMSDILASILTSQLNRVDSINQERVAIWNTYHRHLKDWADQNHVKQPTIPPGVSHVGHLYYLRFPFGADRDKFLKHMRSKGVNCVFHYQALNTSPVGRSFGGRTGMCPVAESASEDLVRLPIYVGLSQSDLEKVLEAVTSFRVVG